MSKFDHKFWSDTSWNGASLVVQAFVGVAINFIVLALMGPSSLGVFNQLYAVFVVAGQFSVFGLHDSALKHSSEYSEKPEESNLLATASVLASLLTGILSAVCLAFLGDFLARIFESPEVGHGILWLAPGLFLFTVNKVLLAILNGRRRMISFAVGQAVRALIILLVVGAIVWQESSPAYFGLSFTLAEGVVVFLVLFFMKPVTFRGASFVALSGWILNHFKFGSKALVHGFLSESYIRIDILMLGIFVSDALVGIYSFAAFFLEGVYQISIVFRNISNPILVRLLTAKDLFSFAHYTRRTALYSFSATLLVTLGIIFIYPYLKIFVPSDILQTSYPILIILLAGLTFFSIVVPFDYIFLQAGRPAIQSLYMTMNVLSNVVLNYFLIPPYGLYGAGIATALSFIFSAINLNWLSAKTLNLPGGIFIFPRKFLTA